MPKETKLLIKKALIVGESRKHFKDLITGLREELKPEGFYENLLVNKIVVDYWRLKKLLNYEKDHFLKDNEFKYHLYHNNVSQLVLYQKSIEKSIEKGLSSLKQLQKDRKINKFDL